MFIRNSVIVL